MMVVKLKCWCLGGAGRGGGCRGESERLEGGTGGVGVRGEEGGWAGGGWMGSAGRGESGRAVRV